MSDVYERPEFRAAPGDDPDADLWALVGRLETLSRSRTPSVTACLAYQFAAEALRTALEERAK